MSNIMSPSYNIRQLLALASNLGVQRAGQDEAEGLVVHEDDEGPALQHTSEVADPQVRSRPEAPC
jgi:hypothetical protein